MNARTLLFLSCAVFGLSACSPKEQAPATPAAEPSTIAPAAPSEPAPAATTNELVNTYWKLVGLNGKDVVVSDKQREPHLVFATDNRVAGSDGCNRIAGDYTLDGDKITLGQMIGTRMACMENADQAQAFNAVLSNIGSYQIQGSVLDLFDSSGAPVARFAAVALQ